MRGPAARHVVWTVVGAFVLVFGLHLLYASAYRFPIPAIHDEFAYLLAGDTFASGRITNPPHPLWVHFETFHVLQLPSYQAKYPPGQGGFLALGILMGHPVLGVWLGIALAAAATCWMLAGLIPLGWAFVVPLLFLMHSPVFQGWGQRYWGGGVAMLGGALFFGGLLRFHARAEVRFAWLAGLGLFLLANTRPLEGLVAAVVGTLALRLLRGDSPHATKELLRRAAPALIVTLLFVVGWMLYYDWRVTGDPLRMPYWEWSAQDSPHPELHPYAGSDPIGIPGKLRRLQAFFLGGTLTLALPFLFFRRRDRRVHYALAVVAAVLVVSVLGTKAWPHYTAPVTCLGLFLLAQSLGGLSALAVGRMRLGLFLALGLVVVHLGLSGSRRAAVLRREPQRSWHLDRQAVVDRLEGEEGQHLVLVRYAPDRSLHEEWIYNAADIDASRVVWARDLGHVENEALLEYFEGRRLWLVTPSSGGGGLRAYERGD